MILLKPIIRWCPITQALLFFQHKSKQSHKCFCFALNNCDFSKSLNEFPIYLSAKSSNNVFSL